MIEVNNIYKSFNSKSVLDNISFKINENECVAIIGQSGMGKSVLLKSIMGLIDIDAGNILVDNKDIIISYSFYNLCH